MNRARSAAVTSLVALLPLACAGATASPSPPSGPVAQTPVVTARASGNTVNDCLAIAGAKHPSSPDQPAKIGAKHVLVKYVGSKRAPATVTRTREEACLRAEEARAKLEQGTPFAEVVAKYSEEQGAASREGSLGSIQRTDVVPPFADAAFELHAGEVSQVVETAFGFHVILRTE